MLMGGLSWNSWCLAVIATPGSPAPRVYVWCSSSVQWGQTVCVTQLVLRILLTRRHLKRKWEENPPTVFCVLCFVFLTLFNKHLHTWHTPLIGSWMYTWFFFTFKLLISGVRMHQYSSCKATMKLLVNVKRDYFWETADPSFLRIYRPGCRFKGGNNRSCGHYIALLTTATDCKVLCVARPEAERLGRDWR